MPVVPVCAVAGKFCVSIMAAIDAVGKVLPEGLRGRIMPRARSLAAMLTGNDDMARARQMALVAFSVRVVSAGIAFLSQIVQARLMGEYEYGIFAFVWVLVILFGNLSCFGFHTAVIRFQPGYRAAGQVENIRGLAWTVRVFAMVSASVVAAAGFVLLHFWGEAIAEWYLVPVGLGLLILPMIALGDVLDGTARANNWSLNSMVPTYIVRPVLILLFMVAAVQAGAPHTATTAMMAALAATYVTSLSQFFRMSRRLRRLYEHGRRSVEFGTWLRFSLPVFLVDGVGFLLTNADVVMVGLYMPPDQVAVYFAASKTIVLMQFVFFAVKAASAPRFSQLIAAGDRQGLAHFAARATRWAFWPSLVVGGLVLLAGRPLLSLFGPAFTEGHMLMFLLFAGLIVKAVVGPGDILLNMSGHQNLCVKLYILTFIVSLGLNVTLIPMFGLAGAATAVALALSFEALLLHIACRKALGIVLFAFSSPPAAPVETGASPS